MAGRWRSAGRGGRQLAPDPAAHDRWRGRVRRWVLRRRSGPRRSGRDRGAWHERARRSAGGGRGDNRRPGVGAGVRGADTGRRSVPRVGDGERPLPHAWRGEHRASDGGGPGADSCREDHARALRDERGGGAGRAAALPHGECAGRAAGRGDGSAGVSAGQAGGAAECGGGGVAGAEASLAGGVRGVARYDSMPAASAAGAGATGAGWGGRWTGSDGAAVVALRGRATERAAARAEAAAQAPWRAAIAAARAAQRAAGGRAWHIAQIDPRVARGRAKCGRRATTLCAARRRFGGWRGWCWRRGGMRRPGSRQVRPPDGRLDRPGWGRRWRGS